MICISGNIFRDFLLQHKASGGMRGLILNRILQEACSSSSADHPNNFSNAVFINTISRPMIVIMEREFA